MDVRTDYGAFPVWGWFTVPARDGRPAREVHGSIGPRALALSDELATDLQEWADWQYTHQPGPEAWREHSVPPTTDADWQAWDGRGRTLAARLADETGAAVTYGWPADGRDQTCPECGN
jgi:hypothetical protein